MATSADDFGDLTVYEVLERSRNDPDNSPGKPAAEGSWTWWRTGEHPQGVWVAMDWRQKGWGLAYQENQRKHPIFQDQALGESGDWGHQDCHACGVMNEGYPEPRHATNCDGVCKRGTNGKQCPLHKRREQGKKKAEAYRLRNRPVAERILDGSLDEELADIYAAYRKRWKELL